MVRKMEQSFDTQRYWQDRILELREQIAAMDEPPLAWQRSGKTLYRQRANETVTWLQREMTTADNAFCASLDADSEGRRDGKEALRQRAT